MVDRGFKLTYAGIRLLAKCQTGARLTFTRINMGSGDIPDGTNVKEMTAMINPVLDLPILGVKIVGDGTITIDALISNKELTEGFRQKETGIFAKADDENEVLYAYVNVGDDFAYIPAGKYSAEKMEITHNVTTVIDQADNVTAIIDGSVVYVSVNDFYKHTEGSNPHPDFMQIGEEVEEAKYVNCDVVKAGDKLHHISMDNLKRQMLGDISDIPLLNSRVRQLERENAALALKMEAENMMPDCNMLLAENFDYPDSIDLFEATVLSCASGDDSFDVSSNTGFIIGSWYWVTDGIHAEYVQVKSVIKNGNIYRVITEEPIKETYILNATKFYRTTAWINNGKVIASGDILTELSYPSTEWKGISTTTTTIVGGKIESDVKLNTSLSDSGNFIVSDDGVFNESGLISLEV